MSSDWNGFKVKNFPIPRRGRRSCRRSRCRTAGSRRRSDRSAAPLRRRRARSPPWACRTRTGRLVLRDGPRAGVIQGLHAARTVVSHAGEQDAERVRTGARRRGAEQHGAARPMTRLCEMSRRCHSTGPPPSWTRHDGHGSPLPSVALTTPSPRSKPSGRVLGPCACHPASRDVRTTRWARAAVSGHRARRPGLRVATGASRAS